MFLRSLQAKKLKQEAAEKVADQARAIAPVDTGRYRNSIQAIDGWVVADVEYGAAIEFGTSDTPTFAPLRRGAEAALGTDSLKRR